MAVTKNVLKVKFDCTCCQMFCLKFHHCEHPTFREEEDGYQRCGQFLPYEQQGWPSFMGINGDSKFNIKAIFHKFVKKIL